MRKLLGTTCLLSAIPVGAYAHWSDGPAAYVFLGLAIIGTLALQPAEH